MPGAPEIATQCFMNASATSSLFLDFTTDAALNPSSMVNHMEYQDSIN